jgi:hypothetical protein
MLFLTHLIQGVPFHSPFQVILELAGWYYPGEAIGAAICILLIGEVWQILKIRENIIFGSANAPHFT